MKKDKIPKSLIPFIKDCNNDSSIFNHNKYILLEHVIEIVEQLQQESYEDIENVIYENSVAHYTREYGNGIFISENAIGKILESLNTPQEEGFVCGECKHTKKATDTYNGVLKCAKCRTTIKRLQE